MKLTKEIIQNGHFMYCRKSSEAEDRQMESIPDQTDRLTNTASVKELVVLRVFSDAKSAKMPGVRKDFNEMMSLIDKYGSVKGIVAWKINRLFRNPEEEGLIRQRLSDGRIGEIVTPNKTYYEADSDFVMAVEGAQAQRFIRDLKEDTARGINRKLSKGIVPRLAPPGYKNDTHLPQGLKTISPHPVYFDLMRELFNIALTGNYSTQKLYEKAKEMGIKNSRENPISRTRMYNILKDPFYTGDKYIYAGKTFHNGTHRPMITHEEYDILQGILQTRSRTGTQKHTWSLGELISCGFCGRQITFEKHTKPSGLVFCYGKCSRKYKTDCPQIYVPLKDLEEQAYNYLGRIRVSARFVEWAIRVLKRATDEEKEAHQAKYKALRKEQDEIKEKLYSLQMKWATTDMIDEVVFSRGTEELKTRRKKIHQMLENEDKDFDQTTDLTVATFKFARDAQKKWDDGGPEYRKGIMKVIGSSLVLSKKGKLELKPRTPFLLIQKAIKKEPAVQSPFKMLYARLNSEFEANTGTMRFSNPVVGG